MAASNLIKRIVLLLSKKPGAVFLIDGFGAALTACLLFLVLSNFHEYIGVPQTRLIYLSAIAVIFCLYSTACFFFLKKYFSTFIRIISAANLVYCVVTLGAMISYRSSITIAGISYFAGEIVLICILANIELSVAKAIDRNTKR
jgi:hypothetical protein